LESGGFAAIVKAVREYRMKYPDKAVTYFADRHCPSSRDGWAVLMGGGSFADVRLPRELAQAVTSMRPIGGVVDGPEQWCLANDDGEMLIYASPGQGGMVTISPPLKGAEYVVTWLDVATGRATSGERVRGAPIDLELKAPAVWLRPNVEE
jgi:hypothetical protein